jgi:hypothetical protein
MIKYLNDKKLIRWSKVIYLAKVVRALFLIFYYSSFAIAQVSNVQQTNENGRIVITYDLQGKPTDIYDLIVSAQDGQGREIKPIALVGNNDVIPGSNHIIWWEPLLDGYPIEGWKVTLSPKMNYLKKLNIQWILVENGPGGNYYISATEVTFDQFDLFCEETGYNKPSSFFVGRGKKPVINILVKDALAFCSWLSEKTGKTIRIPEENEWEFAARGGRKSKHYRYSGSNHIDEVAWYDKNSDARLPHDVATKAPNELGIYDMSGNVWEWCGYYGVIRGGSCDRGNEDCKISSRYNYKPLGRYDFRGFRILQK